MDELDYLEEEQIKTHKEILSMLRELDEFEEELQHPTHREEISCTDETREDQEILEQKPPVPVEEKQDEVKASDEPKKIIRNRIFSMKIRQKKKVPKALVEVGKKSLLKRIRKKHAPDAVLIPSRTTDGLQNGIRTLSGTFTLRINDEGNLIGLPVSPPQHKPKKETKGSARFLRRKKQPQGTESEKAPEPPTGGIKGKITKLIPRRKKNKEESGTEETTESGRKAKLKGLISRRRKTKETTE